MHDYYLKLEEVSDWVTECLSISKNESSYEKEQLVYSTQLNCPTY